MPRNLFDQTPEPPEEEPESWTGLTDVPEQPLWEVYEPPETVTERHIRENARRKALRDSEGTEGDRH